MLKLTGYTRFIYVAVDSEQKSKQPGMDIKDDTESLDGASKAAVSNPSRTGIKSAPNSRLPRKAFFYTIVNNTHECYWISCKAIMILQCTDISQSA